MKKKWIARHINIISIYSIVLVIILTIVYLVSIVYSLNINKLYNYRIASQDVIFFCNVVMFNDDTIELSDCIDGRDYIIYDNAVIGK